MSNAFDEAVKAAIENLVKKAMGAADFRHPKQEDILRADYDFNSRPIVNELRPFFDKERDEIGKLTDQLYSVTTSIHDKADKVHVLQVVEIDSLQATIAERDKEIKRLREALLDIRDNSHSGLSAKSLAVAALADKPEDEG